MSKKIDVSKFKLKLFMDGAEVKHIADAVKNNPLVKGFTTNPTLMKKAGVTDYKAFAHEAIKACGNLPISFEVFSDDLENMEREARIIASWGKNANVKIPITNTKGESTCSLIKKLAHEGVTLNVTAIMGINQVEDVAKSLSKDTPAIVSVFAGRIADTGLDPVPHMKECVKILKHLPKAELLWASPREFLNYIQAEEAGCHIITATPDIINKMKLLNKNLDEYSLETVKMFYNDAQSAGYKL